MAGDTDPPAYNKSTLKDNVYPYVETIQITLQAVTLPTEVMQGIQTHLLRGITVEACKHNSTFPPEYIFLLIPQHTPSSCHNHTHISGDTDPPIINYSQWCP